MTLLQLAIDMAAASSEKNARLAPQRVTQAKPELLFMMQWLVTVV
jgi:hypothetical protein